MSYNPQKHHRRSIRLPGYDYSQPGFYFVTIRVHGGECLLGTVVDQEMQLSELGQIANDFWAQVQAHFPNVSIDTFGIMPNHLHVIVAIHSPSEVAESTEENKATLPLQKTPDDAIADATFSHPERPTLGQIIAYYKYQTTKRINQQRGTPGVTFWQRNYWEHTIRNEQALDRIREYIENNPARWEQDQLHPTAPPNRFNRFPRSG